MKLMNKTKLETQIKEKSDFIGRKRGIKKALSETS